jgi:acetyltransferase-like isoleucine patch superfamily enzyme
MGLGRRIFSAAVTRVLRLKGVECGPGLVAYGLPFVARAPGSHIALGARVALCSSTSGNPLGVNHRVVLRTVTPAGEIRIGADSGLSGASICAARRVCIGAQCLVGANVAITDYDFHPVAPAQRRFVTDASAIGCAEVIIEDNVWIGMNVLILKGVRIGANSVIGAGSVVSRSVPPNCVAAGAPATVVRRMDVGPGPSTSGSS